MQHNPHTGCGAAAIGVHDDLQNVGNVRVNSAFRTIAQQYLLLQWHDRGRCGIRAAAPDLSPGAITLGRLLVSTAILSAVALVRRERLPSRTAIVPIAAFGILFMGVYSVVLNAAEREVYPGTAAMTEHLAQAFGRAGPAQAAQESRPVGMEHLILATRTEFQKQGKLSVKHDFGPYFDLIRSEARP